MFTDSAYSDSVKEHKSKASVVFLRSRYKLSLVDDFVSKVDTNDRPTASKAIEVLWKIFEILQKKGYLRDTLRENTERTKFISVMKDSDRLSAAYNMLFHAFATKGLSRVFAEHNAQFGFDEDGVAYLFLSESISTVVRTSELFKNAFLYVLRTAKKHSKDGFWSRMTLGQLSESLNLSTNGLSMFLTDKMNVKLRNALAHGLFWLEGSMLVYCDDITLQKQSEIAVSELWIKTRQQSLILQCLLTFIGDYFQGT